MILAQLADFHPRLMAIERAAHLVPWTEKVMRGCFGPGYTVIILIVDHVIAGFYISHEVADEVSLMNIAVHPDYQGKGYGSVLLNDLLIRASSFTESHPVIATQVFLEVRESNTAAIRLYERYGFNKLGKRPGYYPPKEPNGQYETAIVYGRSA